MHGLDRAGVRAAARRSPRRPDRRRGSWPACGESAWRSSRGYGAAVRSWSTAGRAAPRRSGAARRSPRTPGWRTAPGLRSGRACRSGCPPRPTRSLRAPAGAPWPSTHPVRTAAFTSMPVEHARDRREVLAGENLGGGHHAGLKAVVHGQQHRHQRHEGLARLPTSPCSSRFIWQPVTVSCRISLTTRFCAPVSGKGSFSL